jgi:hypothetical protein
MVELVDDIFCLDIIVIKFLDVKFFYNHIFTRFGYPLTIVTNQGTHFINDVIHYLTNHFILRHTTYIVYYPQRNGQVESTSKVFGTLSTKLVNKNQND